MKLALILIVLIAVVGICFYAMEKKRNLQKGKPVTEICAVDSMPAIKFEMLPAKADIDESKLVEIVDEKVLARIVDAVPELAKTGVSVGNAVQEGTRTLYEVIIPNGEKLVDSKTMKGAFRAFYRKNGRIKRNANLVKANNPANVATNVASSAMGVASMVVGQYYMTQINNQLEGITQKLSQITDFQDNEFMSKVFALVSQIRVMSEFQTDIMDSDELRRSELIKLDSLEHECAELLGQVNKTISDFSSRETNSYEEYQTVCETLQKWILYQKTLLELMCRIAELRFAMRLGDLSVQQCSSLLNTYVSQTEQTRVRLSSWHQEEIKKHGVHLELSNRKRDGFDGVIHRIPAIFNERHGYRPIPESIVTMIEEQIAVEEKPKTLGGDELYGKDVYMIVKGGKIYFLPKGN